MITAKIHVSSASAVLPSAAFPAGGWNATFRPSCNGSCFARASLRAFGSLENGIAGEGPVELREDVTCVVIGRVADIRGGVTDVAVAVLGDGGLGRLFRFSE